MKRLISLLCCMAMVLVMFEPAVVRAAGEPSFTVNGRTVTFYRETVYENGTWLLPFKELMNKAGVHVSYDEKQKAVVGELNEAAVKIPANSSIAYFDEVGIELFEPTRGLSDDVLVETRFIDMIYEAECEASDKGVAFTYAPRKADEEAEVEVVDNVDEYLKGFTPKNYIFKPSDISGAKISNEKLVRKKQINVDDGVGFDTVLEVDNLVDNIETYYDSQITIDSTGACEMGDVIVATLYVRRINTVDEFGYGTIAYTFELLDGTWKKAFENRVEEIGDKWVKQQVIFRADQDVPEGGAQLACRVGFRKQTVQIGGIEFANYGKRVDIRKLKADDNTEIATSYYGREDGALWREEAFRRIEKYRKNDIKVNVKDDKGNPIKDAKVQAEMTRSEFIWGFAAQGDRFLSEGRYASVFQDIARRDFNSIVMENASKANAYHLRQGVGGVNFVRNNNMYFRLHTLLWDATGHLPSYMNDDTTDEEVLKYTLEHASRVINLYGDTITEIDVLNEAVNNYRYREKYGSDFIAKLFKVVDEMAPNARLLYNETMIHGSENGWRAVAKLKALVKELKEKGAPIDGVGIQNHSSGFNYPQDFYNQIDSAGEGLDYIAITEYDYGSGLSDNVEKDAVEADYFRDSIILAYSHPKVTGFTMWGFTDYGHWLNNAPLFYSDMEEKPGYKHWRNYVWGEWFTNEEAVTDETGSAAIRGHRGEYDITVSYGDKTAKTTLRLTKDGENTVDVIVKDNDIDIKSSQEVNNVRLLYRNYI